MSTWIDRIVVRVAYAYLSRRPPRTARLEAVPEIPAGDASAEQRAHLRQAAQRLYHVLDRLDAKLRVAFSLHVIDGRPLTEVATLMSASLVATKTRVWRARREAERRAKKDPLLQAFIEARRSMPFDRKFEVEPLAESSWNRIERAVFEQLDAERPAPREDAHARARRRRCLAFGGVAAAALAGAFALALIGRGARPETSRIVTAEAGSQVTYGEAALEVQPQSAVLISGSGVTCDIAPRHGRPPFTVQAGGVRVRVVGTRFSVTRAGDSARVSVEHGVVEVTEGGRVARLGAGERWPGPAAHATAPAPVAPRPEATRPVTHTRAEHRARPTAAAPATSHQPPATLQAPATPQAPRPSDPAPATTAPAPAPSAAARFEAAARLERRDPDAAAAAYARLADEGGPWAPNALYAAGRLAADRGRHGDARTLLERYLARHPRGANAEDARQLLLRLK